LKEKRKCRGFSQAKLAKTVGVSTHHIAMMEIARNYGALDLVERIAGALDVEIHEMLKKLLSAPEEMERLYQAAARTLNR
jgi:transcriptional regulator with XRE-family HTH domain